MSISPTELGHILLLFEKLHNLSISKEEYAQLIKWRDISVENRQIFDDFLHQQMQDIDVYVWNSFDTGKALDKVNGILKNKKSNFMYRLVAAASIIILLSIGMYFFKIREYNKDRASRYDVAHQQDILPAVNKASLNFSDNSITILLDSSKNSIRVAKNEVMYQNGQKVLGNEDKTKLKEAILSVPRGGKYQIELEDGTKVWLNSQTDLKFPSSFANAKHRDVELFGEAYFEVAHNAHKPFRVKMGDNIIEVLGTTFGLVNYETDTFIKSTLITGKIRIHIPYNNNIVLNPGQQASYNKKFGTISIINDANIKKALAWKNGDFVFDDEPIQSIIKQMERWYDVDIIDKTNIKLKHFSGIVSREQPLSAVLEMFTTLEKIKYNINKERKEVVLYSN